MLSFKLGLTLLICQLTFEVVYGVPLKYQALWLESSAVDELLSISTNEKQIESATSCLSPSSITDSTAPSTESNIVPPTEAESIIAPTSSSSMIISKETISSFIFPIGTYSELDASSVTASSAHSSDCESSIYSAETSLSPVTPVIVTSVLTTSSPIIVPSTSAWLQNIGESISSAFSPVSTFMDSYDIPVDSESSIFPAGISMPSVTPAMFSSEIISLSSSIIPSASVETKTSEGSMSSAFPSVM